MEEVIRGYFDACNTGDADAVATFFAPGAPRRVWVELSIKF